MFSNTFELTTAGILAAAAEESRRLGGLVNLVKVAKANGNVGGMRLALARAYESVDRIERLMTLAAEWSAKVAE